MAANTALNVAGLNFNEIRANLRDFIAAKPEFADYDFQDSAIGTLLDLLAYNTYYNAFYANMAASESFIDSAQFYDSVVSRAKLVGYVPTSAHGATANVRISFTSAVANSTFTSITIPKDTKFTATINSVAYTFVTPKSYVIVANTSNLFQGDVDIVEGYPLTHRYLYTTSNTAFVLPNANVDTRSISVTVNSAGNTQTYLQADDILTVNSSSKIFYLDGDRDYKYKVSFGDNVLGRRPDYNSTVAISYRVCSATRGNGANNFTATGSIGGQSNFSISTNARASGGSDQQDIESVRFNAPRMYEIQNRAVTAQDYQRIILDNNPDLQMVNVWGGEENDPPIYGKVYVVAKPKQGTLISSSRKEQIKTFIRKYSVQSIDIEFSDPTFLYIIPSINVQYDSKLTTTTSSGVAVRVSNRIIGYESNNLNKFDGKFRFSRFLDYLDGADDGIVGSTASIRIQKRFNPSLVKKNTYTFKFNQQIVKPLNETAVTSSAFTFAGETCYLDDDNNGNVRIYYFVGNSKIYINTQIGSVNYENGTVILRDFVCSAYAGNYLAINVNPITQNFSPIRNQILLISNAVVRVYDDATNRLLYTLNSIETVGQTTNYNETALTSVTVY